MKYPINTEHFFSKEGENATRIIAKLKAGALSEVRDTTNVFDARELLQIAVIATAAIQEINEECPWEFYELSPLVENWPILFNEKTDLSKYRSLKIGYQLLQSKNPRKRGAGAGLYAFLGKEVISKLEVVRTSELLPGKGRIRDEFLKDLETKLRRRNLADADKSTPTETLAELQRRIWAISPKRGEPLPDLTKQSSATWIKAGQNFFKDAFPAPEKISTLKRTILNRGDREHDSVIRTRIIYRVGKAIKSAAMGLEADV